MIVEERNYQIKTGLLQEFWELYKNEGLPIQTKYQPYPIGFFTIDIGEISNFVHMWKYDSYEHREDCRKKLHKDASWGIYAKKSHNYILKMSTRILKPLEYEFTNHIWHPTRKG